MIEYLAAAKALFTFTPYTRLPRFIEIAYGILAWFGVGLIAYALF